MIDLQIGMGSRSKFNRDGLTVRALQKMLKMDVVDGIFGKGTEAAVKHFQARNGLPQDGIVGVGTWAKLIANRTKDAGTWVEEAVTPERVFSQEEFDRDKARLLLPMWNYGGRKKAQAQFKETLKHIEPYLKEFHLSKPEEWILFVSQIREETGPGFITEENLNYRCKVLPQLFSAYGRHGFANPWRDGRCKGHPANQMAIANNAYANRMGNGAPETGDGWRTRGGGGIQLTGTNNQKKYHDWLLNNFPDLYEKTNGDLILRIGADVLAKAPHSILTAIYYWVDNEVYRAVDIGLTEEACNYATQKINSHTHSYKKRWGHMQKCKNLLGL